LEDILEAIVKIRRYTEDLPPERLLSESKTLDAVVRNLEVIGEAAKMVPDSIRAQDQDVDWRKIAGLRDILIHQILRNRPGDYLGHYPKQAARAGEACPADAGEVVVTHRTRLALSGAAEAGGE
jgi:hypothetical protein